MSPLSPPLRQLATPRGSGTSVVWITKLHNMHRPTAIIGAMGVASVICAFDFAYSYVTGHKTTPHTHNPKWQEATRAYLRFQKCNPIFGVSAENPR